MIKRIKNKAILCASILSLTAFSCGLLVNGVKTASAETQNTVNAVTVADKTTFSLVDGASVRYDAAALGENQAAIRFTTRVEKSVVDNNDNVQIVTMITPSRYLDETLQNGFDNDDLTNDQVETIVMDVANKASADLENDPTTYDSSEYYYYNAAIYNVKEANLSRAFSARSYLTIDGAVQYYSEFDFEKNSRSVWQVANTVKEKCEEAGDTTSEEYVNVSKLCAEYKITAGEETLLTVKRGARLAWHESELNAAIEGLTVEDTTNLTYSWVNELTGLPEETASINADVNATVSYNVLQMVANGTAYAVSTGHTLADGVTVTVPATFNNLPVNKVADKAFEKNTAITKVILPDSVTVIGSLAFNEAKNLKTIVMPGLTSTIANLATNSFYRCNALREIVVNRLRLKDWQVFATDANSSAVGTANIYCLSTDTSKIEITYSKNNLLSENIYVYSETEACGYWTWKDGVYGSEIVQTPDHSYTGENGACVNCGAWDAKGISYQYGTISLTTLASDANATLTVNGKRVSELTGYIVKGLLDSHTGTTVEIPGTYNDGTNGTANVIAVGSKAFKDNTTIEKVVLSENVIAIESNAFEGCTSLVAAIMPGVIDRYANPGSGGSYIGTDAFYNCISLETLVVSSLNQVGRRVFYVDTATYTDYQPKLKAYRYNAEGTAKFGTTFRVSSLSTANMFAIKTDTSGVVAAAGSYYLYSVNEPTETQWATTSDWWHFDENGNVVVWTKN